MPETIFCKIILFCQGKFGSSSLLEPVKLTGDLKKIFVREQYLQLQFIPSHFAKCCCEE